MRPVSMDGVSVALQGFGMDSACLLRLAKVVGLPLWSHHAIPAFDRVVVLWGGGAGDDCIAFPWQPPAATWIESTGLMDEALPLLLQRAAEYDLFASFTTATANDLYIAGGLLSAVTARRTLDVERREDIELALHEALSNAIIHGNLSMEGLKKLSVDDLDSFSRLLVARMSDPDYAGRRIEIRIQLQETCFTIDILDEGCGFSMGADAPIGSGAASNPFQPSGRGFELIRAIAQKLRILDNGRRIWMEFEW